MAGPFLFLFYFMEKERERERETKSLKIDFFGFFMIEIFLKIF